MTIHRYIGFDVIDIPAQPLERTKYKYVESDWIVNADGTTKTACEINRKTGERRPYDYSKALEAMYDDS